MKKILALILAVLLCACACAENLRAGDSGDQVFALQDRLHELGYLYNEPDGIYGQNTASAISAFQRENGLEATGEADDATLMLLGGDSALIAAQHRLIALGYLEEAGELGAMTAAALGLFQRDRGLEVTGELNEETAAALLEEKKPAQDRDYSNMQDTAMVAGVPGDMLLVPDVPSVPDVPNDMPLFQDVPQAAPADELLPPPEEQERIQNEQAQARLTQLGYMQMNNSGYWGATMAEALTSFQRANDLEATGLLDDATLAALESPDARGNKVRMAQQRLVELGYLIGYVDGAFGEQSRQALADFKSRHGLPADGKMDQETWDVLFSEDVTRLYPTLKEDHKGETVRMVQARLIDLGFLTGSADGKFGGKTVSAVKAFQQHLEKQGKANGIEADGQADPDTQALLLSDRYSSYLKNIAAGDEDGEVRRIERRLKNLGYMDAEPDELFDEYAVACLEAFQDDAGLVVSGIADKDTVNALFRSGAAEAKRYVMRALSAGDEGGVVRDVQDGLLRLGMLGGQAGNVYNGAMEGAVERLYEYLLQNGREEAKLFEARKVISVEAQKLLADGDLHVYAGDVGQDAPKEEIVRLQRRLDNLFYLSADAGADGKFGKSTREAVEKFQEVNGLPVTGIADEATQERLYSKEAVGNWTKYMLEIRIDEQRVYAYALNAENEYELLHKFICSTGLGDTTPLGVFSETTERLNRWHFFVEYKCWAQYSWRIIGNYYFHSVLYDEQDEKTIRETSVYNLGSKASHGCVRLEVESAKWIFENCDAGTIVYIH